jgi:hypothetical protein
VGSTFKQAQLTFQIGLHIDDLNVLRAIQSKLGCGNISVNGDRCNYYVSDIYSLYHIILPLFDHFILNSSKRHIYLIWRDAVILLHNGLHLTDAGRQQLLILRKGIASLVTNAQNNLITNITPNWLLGFIEGDASFSMNNLVPRLRFENTAGDTALLLKIQAFLGFGNMGVSDRKRTVNEKATAILELSQCGSLISILIPMLVSLTWYTKKFYDFSDWSIMTDMYWKGYHLLPEGACLFGLYKSRMNNFRLTSNPHYNGDLVIDQAVVDAVYTLPAPYDIHPNCRTLAGTTNFVSEPLGIIATSDSITLEFTSLSKAGKALHIDRTKIKSCILSSKPYKGYMFKIKQ